MRYVLEGEWSGYVSAQQKVHHREIVPASLVKDMRLHTIQFTDGTYLRIKCWEAKPRERIETKDQYGRLIRDAIRIGKPFVTVSELKQ